MTDKVMKFGDGVFIKSDKGEAVGFVICDDCREAYPPPAYYTFESEGCIFQEGDDPEQKHMDTEEGCTGNLCPDCAGPHVDPDYPEDEWRRPGV